MKYILSLDGGGIRGIIPATVLAQLEKETGTPIAEMFDLIAGTSTGGILALGLSMDDGNGAPKYAARDLIRIYEERGSEIFHRSLWRGLSTVAGISEEKYSDEGLMAVLDDYFGNEPLGAALTRVLITSYDIQNREPLFFKSWREEWQGVEMRHAARATSAAPTYFEPALIPVGGSMKALIDGGVFINNPAVSAYAEARRLFPDEELFMVSVGTGELIRPIAYSEAKDWGMLQWMLPALSCMFDGVNDACNYQMRYLLGDNYIRLQTTLSTASDDMDNATGGNIQNLLTEASRLLRTNKTRIKTFVDRRVGEVT